MRARLRTVLAAGACLAVMGGVAAPKAFAQSALVGLSFEYDAWDGGEFATSTTPAGGGINFYTKTVFAPAFSNIMYVTLMGTGDVHSDSQLLIRCRVDGVNCNPGAGSSSGNPGWIVLQRLTTDSHDNAIGYKWCANIAAGGPHTVTLDLASNGAGTVFIEAIAVQIDSSIIPSTANRCVKKNTAGGGD